jgi:hypothetical protein
MNTTKTTTHADRMFAPRARMFSPQGRMFSPEGRMFSPQGRMFAPTRVAGPAPDCARLRVGNLRRP